MKIPLHMDWFHILEFISEPKLKCFFLNGFPIFVVVII
jgi:hypothetical protein